MSSLTGYQQELQELSAEINPIRAEIMAQTKALNQLLSVPTPSRREAHELLIENAKSLLETKTQMLI